MTDSKESFDDIEVAIEFRVADAGTVEELRMLFVADDVLESHAFSGAEIVTVITTLGKGTIGKLIDFFAKKRTATPKTTFKIGKNDIAMTGYSREDVEALLASPHFKAAVRAAKKK